MYLHGSIRTVCVCVTVIDRVHCMTSLSSCPAAVPMSVDHKPNSREERTRIEDAGGVVVWAGTWRVGGVLAVSRAFGDRPLKRYVIPTPDIREEGLTEADECLILASDGLWDVISNQVGGGWCRAIRHAYCACIAYLGGVRSGYFHRCAVPSKCCACLALLHSILCRTCCACFEATHKHAAPSLKPVLVLLKALDS